MLERRNQTFPTIGTHRLHSPSLLCQHTMTDFFQSGADEIDFDRAASAFPDISLDGDADIPIPSQAPPLAAQNGGSGFSFDDFDTPSTFQDTAVKVTGDDEIEKFESEFPDIDVGQVSSGLPFQDSILPCKQQLYQTSGHYKGNCPFGWAAFVSICINQSRQVLILYTAAPVPTSAATIFWRNLCPTASVVCVLIDSNLEPTH